MALLELARLTVRYRPAPAYVRPAVNDVTLSLDEGERVGVTGPSGCGKTTLALAVLGLLPATAELSGSIRFRGRELAGLTDADLRPIRGAAVSIVFQESAVALNPLMPVGAQIAEVVRAHSSDGRAAARARALAALEDVGFDRDLSRIYDSYPHQLSGGQRQRILFAQAAVCKPALVIADEPTASLDWAARADILRVIRRLSERHGTAFLVISHSADVLAAAADRVVGMREGRLVPVPTQVSSVAAVLAAPRPSSVGAGDAPLLEVRQLTKTFRQRRFLSRRGHSVEALRGVDLSVSPGQTLGLAGESGSGKSTLARCIAGFEAADSGDVRIGGESAAALRGRALLRLRNGAQLIFQDSAAALNPRFSAVDVIAEPLVIQGVGTRHDRRRRALELMEQVELPTERADARCAEFSGGQRQRLAIARALAVQPRLLILDEAFSGLDVATRNHVLDVLRQLQQTHGLAFLCISHDLDLLARFASDLATLHRGRIVPGGPAVSAPERRQRAQAPALRAAETATLAAAG
jgi:peptide/nickel transport system ATP-binding protein